MNSEKKRTWNDWPVWVGVLLAVLALYGGAYALIVEPASWGLGGGGFAGGPEIDAGPFCRALYSYDATTNRVLCWIFGPANWIDRTFFPDRWHGKFVPTW